MSWEAQRTRIAGRIWQAITQSGIDLSAIPRDQQEKMVGTITEGVLVEFNEMMEDLPLPPEVAAARNLPIAGAAGAGSQSATDEQILWEGRAFLSLVERYIVTNQRVRIVSGLVGRSIEDIELIRVKDVDHTQGAGERLLGIGDVALRSSDPNRPDAILRNVSDPEKVHEIVRRAMLDNRRRFPYIVEQQM